MHTTRYFKAKNLLNSMQFSFPYRKVWINIFSISLSIIILPIMVLYVFLLDPRINGLIFSEITNLPNAILWIIVGIGFLVFWISFLLELLWLLKGEEVIEVAEDYISIKHQILGLSRSKIINADKIDFIFVSNQKIDFVDDVLSSNRRNRFFDFRKGKIAINSGKNFLGSPNTFRFGSVLNDVDAKQIVAVIHRRFPQYKPGKSKTG